jgi:hypothetical protein
MVIRGGYSLTFDRTNGVAIVMVPILGVGFAQTHQLLGAAQRRRLCGGQRSD